MIELKPMTIADRDWADALIRAENSRSADFSFGGMYMWDHRYHQRIGELHGRLVVMPDCPSAPFFAYPVGSGPLTPVIDELHACLRERGLPLILRSVTARQRATLEELFPERFDFTPDRDYFDYVYSAEKLSTLAGKKLHGKRNHINRFLEENPDWAFLPLTPELYPVCVELLDQWEPRGPESEDISLVEEHNAILCALRDFDALRLDGGVLFAGKLPVAFTVGERLCSDTYNVHFEKAMAEINGAYPMINREFVRHIRSLYPDIVYINREDDAGMENLRKAKESYYPEFLVEKFTAVWK